MLIPDNGYVRSSFAARVATITFYHPAQNSLPSSLLAQLADEIHAAGRDEQTRIIVLKSAGDRTFCSGASFSELVQLRDKEAGAAFFRGFANVINACRSCGKLVIARVQGKAVGGGVGLAAAADYCLATDDAAVKLSEVSIGIGPFVIEPAVKRKIGLSAFSSLAINATEFQTAAWAKRYGLFNEVFPNLTELDTAVDNLATKLASYNPDALVAMKKILWQGTEDWEQTLIERAAISGDLVLSTFTQEALQRSLSAQK